MEIDINVLFSNKKIKGDIIGDSPVKSIFLHGAGKAESKGFDDLRKEFWENKISSVAFDFIGHGRTGGGLSNSSLEERTKQALAIIENINIKSPVIIVGRSMSGYTAIKLTELLPIKILILMVPAVYTTEAYDVGFDFGFTEIIRRKKSWVNSDAFDILNKFSGKLLIIGAEYDEIIPREVLFEIFKAASNAHKKDIYIIPKSNHNIREYLDNNKSERKIVYNKIINFIIK